MFVINNIDLNKEHKSVKLLMFIALLLSFFLFSCTVNYEESNYKLMFKQLEGISKNYINLDKLIIVKVDTQELYFLEKGTIREKFTVSTSVYGTGSEVNSFKTPLGKHVITEKIGKNLPFGAILKGREWTGALANIIKEPIDTEFDVVTSRILWLSGLEEGLNLGPGVDSKSRYIYIHGTAEEGLIGRPASDGCVRMYNNDVISLFEKVDTDTEVWII